MILWTPLPLGFGSGLPVSVRNIGVAQIPGLIKNLIKTRPCEVKVTVEPVAAKTPLWTSTKAKTGVENAFGHWQKHGAEFPEFQNAKQYVESVKDFFSKPPSGTLMKTRPNGDTLFYNPANPTSATGAKNEGCGCPSG